MANDLDKKIIKSNSWHLKVKGAYVQQPTPGIYGLEEDYVINSVDATALYPITTVMSNISSETLFGRVYDTQLVSNFMGLIKNIFSQKAKGVSPDTLEHMIIPSFTNALKVLLKDYSKRENVKNVKEAEMLTFSFYPKALKKIIHFTGSMDQMFAPTTDEEYFLLRSCFYPLIESITWLSPQNKGHSQLIVDFVFHPDEFDRKYTNQEIYMFTNYNSTKLNFKILTKNELEKDYFSRFLLNPYGSLFYTHKEKLAFEVQLIVDSLAQRRIIKNQMLVLDAIIARFSDALTMQKFLLGQEVLTEKTSGNILTEINDTSTREFRIKSLMEVDFENQTFFDLEAALKFLILKRDQADSLQNGIKVSLNSGYGILGMISYEFSDIIAANSITNGGKIFGIKTFQCVSSWVMQLYEDKLGLCDDSDNWFAEDWADLQLIGK